MAISAPEATNEEEEYKEYGESETEEGGSDDSEDDPTYDIVKKIRLSLSKLSVKKSKSRTSKTSKEEDSGNEEDLDFTEVKRSKSRTSKTSKEEDSGNEEDLDFTKVKRSKSRTSKTSKEEDSGNEEDLDFTEVKVPKLNKEEEKCFETVEKIIQAGQLEKLKVDQCKVYLRKYGLRLTGKKDVLIGRIKEHLEVVDGSGEKRYPVSSFVINCKGDACTGDVVMFEQKVYEMYNIASRSATAPPCGTRIIAGRIVKESYGAAKQQHTFTIEVLWSRGEKVLPPLHPLLIKGRNIYRLHTMRQPWVDEDERRKVLHEKHTRGFMARTSRDQRTKEKEMRKTMTNKRMQRKESCTKPTQEKCNQQLQVPTQVREDLQLNILEENLQADIQRSPYRSKENWQPNIQRRSPIRCNETWQQDILVQPHKNGWTRRNPLGAIDYNKTWQQDIQVQLHNNGWASRNSFGTTDHSKIWQQDILIQQHNNGWASRNPVGVIDYNNTWQHDILVPQHKNGWAGRNQFGAIDHRRHFHEQKQTDTGFHHHRQLVKGPVSQQQTDAGFHHRQLAKGPVSQQWCPYYPQGRCRFGDSCKFLHE